MARLSVGMLDVESDRASSHGLIHARLRGGCLRAQLVGMLAQNSGGYRTPYSFRLGQKVRGTAAVSLVMVPNLLPDEYSIRDSGGIWW